jgi:acyl-CoA thioesterase FadM
MSNRLERGGMAPIFEETVPLIINEKFRDPNYPLHTWNIGYTMMFEDIRNATMDSKGINFESLATLGLLPFTIGVYTDFRGQSKPGDTVDVTTSVYYHRRGIRFRQEMKRDGAVIARSRCTYLLVDKETFRPQIVPQSLVDRFT